MMFSVTERGTFKRCERQWRLSSKNGMHYGPIIAPIYLGVGTVVHDAGRAWLDDWYTHDGAPQSTYVTHAMLQIDAQVQKARERYKRQVGVEMSSVEEDALWEIGHYARTMCENYEIRWGRPLPEGFTLVSPEQRAQIPVPGTEHECEYCHGARRLGSEQIDCPECHETGVMLHHLDMRFDALIADRMGRIHVYERKTYNSRPKESALAHSDQFLAYIWGARQLGVGNVVGLAYDGLWRRDKVPKGRSFEDLFFRYEHLRSEAEFAEFSRLLPYELNEMYSKRPEVRPLETLPFDRRWMGCFDCRFDDGKDGQPGVCSAMSRGETQLVDILLKTKFSERDDDLDADAETEVEA